MEVVDFNVVSSRINSSGDTLFWPFQPIPDLSENHWYRNLEKAMIAPDLFDITYYSIEPKFYQNYFTSMSPKLFAKMPLRELIMADHGSHRDNLPAGSNKINVADQLATATNPELIVPLLPYWIVKSADHLLTGWAQNKVDSYDFPKNVYGTCLARPTGTSELPDVPGDCIVGGRTGYSVQLVSGNYLQFDKLQLGGLSSVGGPILNPPPSDF